MKESIYERNARIGADVKRAQFEAKMKMPYKFKKKYAAIRIREFIELCDKNDYSYHVSVGGLDSITLYLYIRSIGYDVPGISASYLEDPSIQKVHRALGIHALKPGKGSDGRYMSAPRAVQQFGFPVLSKEIAQKISHLQNPTEKNKTVRHAIITGETGEYGGHRLSKRMRLAQKWLDRFGGYANEEEGVNYGKPDFRVSDQCCYYLKEKPCDDYGKQNHSLPFLGLMASEGGRRAKALKVNGCNYWSEGTKRSAPFAIFQRDDLLRLALEMDEWYKDHKDQFSGKPVDSIIPAIYGEIKEGSDGKLYTTEAQRTGCAICGFGIHLEKRPHRFDRLYVRNTQHWDYIMNRIYTAEDGSVFGWGHVLDYIGVEWRAETNPLCQITISEEAE